MNLVARMAIVAAVGASVAAAVVLKQQQEPPQKDAEVVEQTPPAAALLPRLVDLGATTCIPCELMAPILDQLSEDFADRLVVEFIDIHEQPAAQEEYGVRLIPTQVFYDADGQELFRHEGFFSREDILAKWQELGVDLSEPTATG